VPGDIRALGGTYHGATATRDYTRQCHQEQRQSQAELEAVAGRGLIGHAVILADGE
jgi:hypothetical protein